MPNHARLQPKLTSLNAALALDLDSAARLEHEFAFSFS
jgi:hypothetical protein